MPSILFVCTANQFRSPLAAGCLVDELSQAGLSAGWIVESAGTWVDEGSGMSQPVLRAARQLGIDLEQHRPRPVNKELMQRFDLILVMESGQKEALQIEFPFARRSIFLLSDMAEGMIYDIPDPGRDPRSSFDAVAEEVRRLVRKAYPSILSRAEEIRRAKNQGG